MIDTNVSKVPIPIKQTHESYRYLGVLINLSLDWTLQIEQLKEVLSLQVNYLKHKAFTAKQILETMHVVFIPAIEYRSCKSHNHGKNDVQNTLLKSKNTIHRSVGQTPSIYKGSTWI